MRNFVRIQTDLDVSSLQREVVNAPDLWNANLLRTTHFNSPHREADDILLRFNPLDKFGAHASDNVYCVEYPAWNCLPAASSLISNVFPVGADILGRCMITRLSSGGMIYPHVDDGACPLHYNRFHVVLQSNERCIFSCDEEFVVMHTGECWWVNNRVMHSVYNGGDLDRLHLIFDVKRQFDFQTFALNQS